VNLARQFDELVKKYVEANSVRVYGYPLEEIEKAEMRLGVRFPGSLRQFYLSVGKVKSLLEIHNKVRSPGEIALGDGYIIFMDENQQVVSWGIVPAVGDEDPEIWQRINGAEVEWYPEGMTLLELLESMFDWYTEDGLIEAPARDA
jgi:hypothetical protein